MPRPTFKKNERLTHKKTFEELFNKGKSFTVPPFRIVYLPPSPGGDGNPQVGSVAREVRSAQLGISVPKRSFAKAVDRNKLKRRIREAYRKNKHILYEVLKNKNLSIALMILYIAKEELPYAEIEGKMVTALGKLAEKV